MSKCNNPNKCGSTGVIINMKNYEGMTNDDEDRLQYYKVGILLFIYYSGVKQQ